MNEKEKKNEKKEMTEAEWDMEKVQEALLDVYLKLLLEQIAKDAKEKSETIRA